MLSNNLKKSWYSCDNKTKFEWSSTDEPQCEDSVW